MNDKIGPNGSMKLSEEYSPTRYLYLLLSFCKQFSLLFLKVTILVGNFQKETNSMQQSSPSEAAVIHLVTI